MSETSDVLFWRRKDGAGFERLTLEISEDAVIATSSVICLDEGGFRLDHSWRLTPDWRAISVPVDKWSRAGHARLTLERVGGGWLANGRRRPDLDGAEEPDLTVTPFCNTFPIRRLPSYANAVSMLRACVIDAADLSLTSSMQRYERLDETHVRYVDLGRYAGFTAVLTVDDHGLVRDYEGLFERVSPA